MYLIYQEKAKGKRITFTRHVIRPRERVTINLRFKNRNFYYTNSYLIAKAVFVRQKKCRR